MAAQSVARAARRSTDREHTKRPPSQVALPTRAVHFDGRDVTEPVACTGAIAGREIVLCHCCGTVRDARFAFCCEFAMSWNAPKAPAAVSPVNYTPAAPQRVAVVSAA